MAAAETTVCRVGIIGAGTVGSGVVEILRGAGWRILREPVNYNSVATPQRYCR